MVYYDYLTFRHRDSNPHLPLSEGHNMSNKKQNFMKGAVILIAANIIVKLIGAAFKIPLTYLLNEEGMALFSTSYTMYTFLFIVATAGLPVAISRMISQSRAKGNLKEVKKIFSVSIRLLAAIGIVGTCVLFFGAGYFADALENSDAKLGIMAIAPAMLFVSLMSAYRGFFQGHQDMYPTALSEVSEAVGKLVIGYICASYFMKYGVIYAAAGAVFGVAMGGFLGFIVLFAVYAVKRKSIYAQNSVGISRSNSTLLNELVVIAVPITIGASVFSLTSLIDMSMIMRNLQAGGFSYKEAKFMWGSYSGYTIPLFNLPPTLISAISISLVPAISGAFSVGDMKTVRSTTENSLLITLLFALPCAVGMACLAEPILAVVYHNTNASSTLFILSFAIVFVSLVMVTNAILQSIGKERIPVINMIIGGVVKILINNYLVKNPSVNINGAPIGTNACYIVILLLNLYWIHREIGVKLTAVRFVVKPVISVAVMAFAVVMTYGALMRFGTLASLFASILCGGVVYVIMIFALRTVTAEVMEAIPGLSKLLPILKKYKLVGEK